MYLNISVTRAWRDPSKLVGVSTGPILILIAVCVLISACEYHTSGSNTSKNIIGSKVDFLARCHSTTDLEHFFAGHSLGNEVDIQSLNRLVFVQTFPYSGVRASHLYVYSKGTDGLFFASFFRVPDVTTVKLKANEDGSVEVTYDGKRLAVLDRLSEK